MSIKAVRADLNEKSYGKFAQIKEEAGIESDAEAVRHIITEFYKIRFPESQKSE